MDVNLRVMNRPAYPFEAGHGKVTEKTLPGQSLECRGVLGIVPLSGAEGIRTPYLLTASQTFSRVNYGPVVPL